MSQAQPVNKKPLFPSDQCSMQNTASNGSASLNVNRTVQKTHSSDMSNGIGNLNPNKSSNPTSFQNALFPQVEIGQTTTQNFSSNYSNSRSNGAGPSRNANGSNASKSSSSNSKSHGNGNSGSAPLGAVNEATAMIQGWFNSVQKKVHEVFNEDDDDTLFMTNRTSHHGSASNINTRVVRNSSNVNTGASSSNSISSKSNSVSLAAGQSHQNNSQNSNYHHHINVTRNQNQLHLTNSSIANSKNSVSAASSTSETSGSTKISTSASSGVEKMGSGGSGLQSNSSSIGTGSIPLQQGMIKKKSIPLAKRECDKTQWRKALDAVGSNCRDLHHSHRVCYDIHRCLIQGTEIEFTCEGGTVKWLRVASKLWSSAQQNWIDKIDREVREKQTTIEDCLKMLLDFNEDESQSDSSKKKDASDSDKFSTENNSDSKESVQAVVSTVSTALPRSQSVGSPIVLEPQDPITQNEAIKNEVVAAPITNQRPILRRNRMAWEWPLTKDCYRQRFVEVLKTECAVVADEREQILMERDALYDKLESIQNAFN